MKSHTEQRRHLRLIPAICYAVSLTFNAVVGDKSVAADKSALLDSADITTLEPPSTLPALIERIGYISRRGLSGSKDIYTESMLSRAFGGKIIDLATVKNEPYTIDFFSAEYALTDTSNGGLNVQDVQTRFSGRWTQYQYGNTLTTFRFTFGPGAPDRSVLEAMLGTKLVEIGRRPRPPQFEGGPPRPTSPDGNKQFRTDPRANSAIGAISVGMGPDGKVSVINLDQETN